MEQGIAAFRRIATAGFAALVLVGETTFAQDALTLAPAYRGWLEFPYRSADIDTAKLSVPLEDGTLHDGEHWYVVDSVTRQRGRYRGVLHMERIVRVIPGGLDVNGEAQWRISHIVGHSGEYLPSHAFTPTAPTNPHAGWRCANVQRLQATRFRFYMDEPTGGFGHPSRLDVCRTEARRLMPGYSGYLRTSAGYWIGNFTCQPRTYRKSSVVQQWVRLDQYDFVGERDGAFVGYSHTITGWDAVAWITPSNECEGLTP